MDYLAGKYDVVVIGAGHAGIEAALAAARLGKKTLILTIQMDSIALMACNPAIGGTSKGHIVREIDALGGQMGLAADRTYLQIKMLNTRKGPAVQALRAQTDKKAYQQYMKWTLENTPNLYLAEEEASEILTSGGKVSGVCTALGNRYEAGAVIAATGVYLKGRVLIGDYARESGPTGLFPATFLSKSLTDLGFELRRFKTGTPARVDGRTVDYSKTTIQYGDANAEPFSFLDRELSREQHPCYLTYTNAQTHEIIRANLSRSPLYTGKIDGIGPRYCPSIEDKVVRFAEKERHQMFLEPEGLRTREVYVQGMSSSLPYDVQVALYRTVPGMENVHFVRPAYAIEYDCIDPLTVSRSLETKTVPGLFTAGQINGTSGYEEAAGQGIIAGINASRYLDGNPGITLTRDQAYIGVLIDDLVTKGTNEPYRMMTSRAEYRLMLRQDNADERLTQLGRDIGLVDDARYSAYMRMHEELNRTRAATENLTLTPAQVEAIVGPSPSNKEKQGTRASELLRRPGITYSDLKEADQSLPETDPLVVRKLENELKYEGYIEKQKHQVEAAKNLERKTLPKDLDYTKVRGLRLEAQSKLQTQKPETVGQASRISGVSPADISVLLVYLASRAGREVSAAQV